MQKRLLTAALAVLAIVATGCSVTDSLKESRGRGDAAVQSVDDKPKEVIQFPDRFGNVAHGCDGHGHRIFITTRVEGVGVQMEIIDDPSCGGASVKTRPPTPEEAAASGGDTGE